MNFKERLAMLLKSKWTERIVVYILVPLLLLYSLWLPPVALGTRLFHLDEPLITPAEGGVVPGPDGASLTVAPDGVAKKTRVVMEAFGLADVQNLKADDPVKMAVDALPSDVITYGSLYRFQVRKEAPTTSQVLLPVPYDLATLETADLYGWDGQTWRWLPSQLDADGLWLSASLQGLPSVLAIGQTQAQHPQITFGASADEAVADAAQLGTAGVALWGPTLASNGDLAGDLPSTSQLSALAGNPVLLAVSNVSDGVVRSDLLDNLLIDKAQRQAHIARLVAAVSDSGYSGLLLDYRGADPALKDEFSAFVQELATALHTANRSLAVSLQAPQLASTSWNTGAYDWQALGQAVDVLCVQTLSDPAAYAEGGAMNSYLRWATSQVDRRKLDLGLTALCWDESNGETASISYHQALSLLAGSISSSDLDGMLLPGQQLIVSLLKTSQPKLQFDPDTQLYSFDYRDQAGQTHTVYIESGASIARKLQYVSRYALGGATVDGALAADSDRTIASVAQTFTDNVAVAAPQFALVWTVSGEDGRKLSSEVVPLDQPDMVWTAPNNPGYYVISAAVSDTSGESALDAGAKIVIEIPTPTFTPTPTNTPTPTATPEATATSAPQPAQAAAAEAAPAATSAPVVAAGSASSGFGYGIQADFMSDGNHDRIFAYIKGLGFNWAKQQIEWFRYNPAPGVYDWGAIDRLVDGANANGINLLLSVVKAPDWARPAGDTDQGPPSDPNTYGTFLREMAARYKGRVKAYEIWNEQNLYYEWGGLGNKLSAAKYVELLKVAYTAIKSVDPNAIVISGALTPTGVNDGNIAIDDRVYLEQMYQAGLARYCDAVGAHPSGYNNPPDADWQSWSDPSTSRCKGHPSWFFRSTLEAYRNIMVKYGDSGKRIWPTEFGWATVEGLGVAPAGGYEYAADNTLQEQADFIVRAYQMGRSWGWVGPMFLWNLNFAPVSGKADEKAAFGIVDDGWNARPAYNALAAMPK